VGVPVSLVTTVMAKIVMDNSEMECKKECDNKGKKLTNNVMNNFAAIVAIIIVIVIVMVVIIAVKLLPCMKL